MKTLHILKNKNDFYALDLIKKNTESDQTTILLIQEASFMEISGIEAALFVLSDDLKERQTTAYQQIGYREMLNMIFEADSVITW